MGTLAIDLQYLGSGKDMYTREQCIHKYDSCAGIIDLEVLIEANNYNHSRAIAMFQVRNSLAREQIRILRSGIHPGMRLVETYR